MSRIAGLGMDLIDLDRVRQALQKNGEAFALRICTPDEWAYCRKHADPVPSLAARFAAKEAVAKALGTGIGEKCAFTDVEVVRNDAGAPSILLHGTAGVTAREQGVTGWFLTMTHSRLSAAAAVIALAEAPEFSLTLQNRRKPWPLPGPFSLNQSRLEHTGS